MTIQSVSSNSTGGFWLMVTNQLVGVVNQLTDGTLYVNGSLVFANAQFSLTLPSITAGNNIVLTAGSGNTLFLQSSNAVINGTAFITGSGTGLYVANNVTIGQKLTVNTVSIFGPGNALTISNNALISGNANVTGYVNTNNLIVTGPAFISGNANVVGALTVGSIQTTGAGSSGSLNIGGSLTVTQNTYSNTVILFQNTAAIYESTPAGQQVSQLYVVAANTITPGNSSTFGTLPGPQIMLQELSPGESTSQLPPATLGLNPAKWIRLNNNVFEIANSNYDVILTLDDLGDFWVSGNVIMNGGSF